MSGPQSLPGDVSIERVSQQGSDVYILRGHERHEGYGSRIFWTAIVVIDGAVARISAMDTKSIHKPFTQRHAGAIRRWLIDRGVTEAHWERLDGSGFRSVKVILGRRVEEKK